MRHTLLSAALVTPALWFCVLPLGGCRQGRSFADAGITDAQPAIDAGPNADGGTDLGTPDEHFPLTPEEILDESTLNPEILSDVEVPSRFVPGTTVRVVRVRYYSHEWHDGSWYGTISVAIPSSIPAAREGVVAFAPMGSINVAPGLDIPLEFGDRTASELGIVVSSIPSSGEHFGLSEVHDLSYYLACQALERRELSWAAVWPFLALRARAATMVANLIGSPVRAAVHHGSSITAYQAWRLPLHDPRFVGLIATGDLGFRADQLPSDADIIFPGSYLDQWTAAGCLPHDYQGDPLLDIVTTWLDPYYLGDRYGELGVGVLQIAGSNDPSTPPATVPKVLARFGGPTHLAILPNYGHGTGDWRHPDLFRMWIEHLVFNRPVNRVDVETLEVVGGRLMATARIMGDAPIEAVRLWYATTSDPNFLLHDYRADTSDDNYTVATWQEAPMTLEAGRWTARVSLSGTETHVAAFIDAEDVVDSRAGYVASPMELLAR